MKYPVYIQKDDDSDYGVVVPDLPGCFSAGASGEEALENAVEAVLTHVEGLMMDGEPVPVPGRIEDWRKSSDFADGFWAMVSVDLARLSNGAKRVNITLPENILGKIDAFALREGETRSGLLASAALEYIAHHGMDG